jgi:tRNA threonylcarbamoyladenosine biosynthesis protein TsaB
MTDGPILAIDTSGASASVALYAGQVLAESTWQSGRRHSAELLPAIDDLLARARIEKQGLFAVAVAVGPGSYSGLRVGVSTAMAMALALNIQVAQVPTLDVIAWAQVTFSPVTGEGGGGSGRRSVRAAIDVGCGRYATARYRAANRNLEHETRIESVGLGDLFELASAEQSLLAVDLDPDCRDAVEREYGARVELAGPAASARRAGFLAELAAAKIKRGELVGDLAVEPIYLRS